MRELRTIWSSLLLLSSLLLACEPAPVSPCDFSTWRAPPNGMFGSVDAGPSWPEFRGLPVTSFGAERLEPRVDVAFVGDGFTREQLALYKEQVDRLVREFAADELSHLTAERFAFHRIDLISATSSVTNSDVSDTALGSCLEPDPKGDLPFIRLAASAPQLQAVVSAIPRVDVLVVLVNSSRGRANADHHVLTNRSSRGPSVVRLDANAPTRVLVHELGHALFGLADEYTDIEEELPRSYRVLGVARPLERSPNVTDDPEGLQWASLVTSAREGGMRYRHGVYHPTDSCRMGDDSRKPFCAVCRAHIQSVMEVLEGTRAAPPLSCGLSVGSDPLVLDPADGRVASPVVTSWTGGLAVLRTGCGACPAERSPNLVRAGAGYIYRDAPSDWSPHRLACETSCRYPGDDAVDLNVVMEFGLDGMPDEGTFEVTCLQATELQQTHVPYRLAR